MGINFNAHNLLWSTKSDAKGNVILDILDQYNLFLLNTGSPTRFGTGSNTCVDLTFTTTNIALNCKWYTFNDKMGSDHAPIFIDYCGGLRSVPQVMPNDKRIHTSKNFDIDNFQKILNEVKIMSATKIKPNPKNKLKTSPTWWNSKYSEIVALRRRAFSKYKSTPSRENYENFIFYEKKAKYILHTEKKNGWHSFCEKLNPSMKIKDILIKLGILKIQILQLHNIFHPRAIASSHVLIFLQVQ